MEFLNGEVLIVNLLIMDTNKILQSDYLDILFDGRNKSYGSYELRLNYQRRMRNAILTLVAASSIFSGYTVIANNIANPVIIAKPIVDTVHLTDIEPPITPPPPPAPPVRPTEAWVAPVIKPDQDVHEKPPEIKTLAKVDIGLHTTDGDSTAIDGPIVAHPGTGAVVVPVKAEIPKWVEQMPEPPYDVNAYLSKTVQYPPFAAENNISGTVNVQFIVSEDGSIYGAQVVGNKHLGGGLETEAVRVVSAMPKWKPGKQNGVPVKVYYVQRITFSLK